MPNSYWSVMTESKAFSTYQNEHIEHWNKISENTNKYFGGRPYHKRLFQIFSFLIPNNSSVLEIGCGNGDLLASIKPKKGLGVDFSINMIEHARERHPEYQFLERDAHFLNLKEMFDVIILSDLINDVWDVQVILSQLKTCCKPKTRIILNFYNGLWYSPLKVAEIVGLARPNLTQNWLAPNDVKNLLRLSGFEVVRSWEEILFPVQIPLISDFFNKFLVRFWPFNQMALTNFIIARTEPGCVPVKSKPSLSIIIPSRNESGNIENIFFNS